MNLYGGYQLAVLPALSGRLIWDADARIAAQQLTPDPKNQPSATESAFQRLDKQLETLGGQLGDLRQAMQELHQSLETEKTKPMTPEKK